MADVIATGLLVDVMPKDVCGRCYTKGGRWNTTVADAMATVCWQVFWGVKENLISYM